MLALKFKPGQKLTALDLNKIVDEISRLAKVSTTAPLTHVDDATGLHFFTNDDSDLFFYIKLTGGGTGGIYAWSQVQDTAGGGWSVIPGGQSGTVANDPAYEYNLNPNIVLSPNPVVRAWRVPQTGEMRFREWTC